MVLATVREAKAPVMPSSTFLRSSLFFFTTSMNWRISSSRLSLSSLCPRRAVFNRPLSW